MEGIEADANGLAYDFGVAIAKGVTANLAYMATKIVTITGSIYALIDAGKAQDELVRKNQLAMGGYSNLLKSVDYFSKKVAKGESYFDTTNLIEGSRALQRAGVDVKKNFSLINDAAQAMGSDFASLSEVIRSGDFGALAEAGLITDRMAKGMERGIFTQEQGTKRILKLLKTAEGKGLFKQNVATLNQTIMRIKQIYKSFMKSIVGDIKDPEGFWFNLRKGFSDFADFFAKRMDKIKKIGQFIGKILVFIVRSIAGFMRWMAAGLKKILGNTDSFFSNWQEKMLSFGLWLEILRVKIGAFFKSWGPVILKIWAVNSALNALWMVWEKVPTRKLEVYYRYFRRLWNTQPIGKMINIINKDLIPAMYRQAVAAWASLGPYALIIAAVVAIVAVVVMLYKYWDDIRKSVNGMSDSTLALITMIFPLVGFIMLMAKYWNEIKTIASNLWQTLVNITDIAMSIGKIFVDWWIGNVKKVWSVVKSIGSWIDEKLTKIVGKPWAIFKNAFLTVYNWIKDKISSLFEDNFLSNAINKIIDFTKDITDASANVADKLAKKSGRESFAKGGTTLADTQKKEIRKLVAQGKSDDEIAKIMDNGNFDKNLIGQVRKENTKPVVKKLDQSSKPGTNNGGTTNNNNQKTQVNVIVSKDADVEKVTAAVKKATESEDTTKKRRTGA